MAAGTIVRKDELRSGRLLYGGAEKSGNLPFAPGRYQNKKRVVANNSMTPLFMAVNEATEEAILNSLFMAETVTGRDNHRVEALPLEKLLPILRKAGSTPGDKAPATSSR